MKTPSWNDLALFAAVARHGALAPAARETGTSPATLSRRMTALEATLERRLFLHGADGYTPTTQGRALLSRVSPMESAAAAITAWHSDQSGPARVRISSGTWTSLDLSENIGKFWNASAPWVPEFLNGNAEMDIARREIDIGIRTRRPDQAWLAGRQIGSVAFAVYGLSGVSGWIGSSQDGANTPSARWIAEHHGQDITTTANDPRIALSLARAGLGKVVLPTFIGDKSGLERQSDPISALTHHPWLVSHHEGRHEPAVRAALTALAEHLSQR